MAKFCLVLLVCLATLASGRRFQSEDEPWVKISDHEVCFETKGGKHGTLKYDGRSGMIGAMKLVHKSGFVRCHYKTVYSSKWGCAHFPGLERYPLNTVVTDTNNHVIYPVPKYLYPHGGLKRALWYYLPATDTLHDKELVFTDYETPFFLRHHATLRIWYGEDLTNMWEHDNSGRVCVDVYAHVM